MQTLDELLLSYRINATREQLKLLHRYKQLLLGWTEDTNLISKNTIKNFDTIHLLDSLLPLQWLDTEGPLIDLGTGGGLPGIVIKIMKPKINVTLSETKTRKIKFLQSSICSLNLKGIDIVNPSQVKPEKKYQVLVVRAFGILEKITREAKRYLVPDGIIFAYKGLKGIALDEVKSVSSRWEPAIREYAYTADGEQLKRTIVTLKKRKK